MHVGELFQNRIVVGWIQERNCCVISTHGNDPARTERACPQLATDEKNRSGTHDAYHAVDLVHGRVCIVVCYFKDAAITTHGNQPLTVGRPGEMEHLYMVSTKEMVLARTALPLSTVYTFACVAILKMQI